MYYSGLKLGDYNRFQIVLHVSALFLAMQGKNIVSFKKEF